MVETKKCTTYQRSYSYEQKQEGGGTVEQRLVITARTCNLSIKKTGSDCSFIIFPILIDLLLIHVSARLIEHVDEFHLKAKLSKKSKGFSKLVVFTTLFP